MSKFDAEVTKRHLEKALESIKHIETKLDTRAT